MRLLPGHTVCEQMYRRDGVYHGVECIVVIVVFGSRKCLENDSKRVRLSVWVTIVLAELAAGLAERLRLKILGSIK